MFIPKIDEENLTEIEKEGRIFRLSKYRPGFEADRFQNGQTDVLHCPLGQFEWMTGLLKDRPTQPWTVFKAGETK